MCAQLTRGLPGYICHFCPTDHVTATQGVLGLCSDSDLLSIIPNVTAHHATDNRKTGHEWEDKSSENPNMQADDRPPPLKEIRYSFKSGFEGNRLAV